MFIALRPITRLPEGTPVFAVRLAQSVAQLVQFVTTNVWAELRRVQHQDDFIHAGLHFVSIEWAISVQNTARCMPRVRTGRLNELLICANYEDAAHQQIPKPV
jgi:hypothetical protein